MSVVDGVGPWRVNEVGKVIAYEQIPIHFPSIRLIREIHTISASSLEQRTIENKRGVAWEGCQGLRLRPRLLR